MDILSRLKKLHHPYVFAQILDSIKKAKRTKIKFVNETVTHSVISEFTPEEENKYDVENGLEGFP
jgi:hypothetical protein